MIQFAASAAHLLAQTSSSDREQLAYMCPVLGPMAPPPRGWVVPIPVNGQGRRIPYGMACFLLEWSWKSLWSSPGPSRTSQ